MKSKRYYLLGLFLAGVSMPVFLLYVFLMTLANVVLDEKTADSSIVGILSHPITMCLYILSLVILPLTLFFKYKKSNGLIKLESIIIDILRWTVALLMFYYGYVKITANFFDYTYRTMDTRVVDVNSFDLTWYYFGKSNLQVILIGLMELIPALLLLFRRTYFIGVLLILPVAGNVLWTNIFNRVSGLTFFVPFIIVTLSSYILYSKKEAIINFFKTIYPVNPTISVVEKSVLRVFKTITFISLICFVVLSTYRIFKHDNKTTNKREGAFEMVSLKVNNDIVVPPPEDTIYYKTIYIESQARWNAILFNSTAYNPKWLTINWLGKTDSVWTYLKKKNAVEFDEVDETSKFTGTYTFTDSNLIIRGIQHKDTIVGLYKKKNLKKNKWYW